MPDLTGRVLLNRYHVREFVGRGGMAEVYKVWDDQMAVHLAMKLLNDDLADDKVFIRRFKREAETLAKLQHPHIVRLYGLEEDGIYVFMLMDFIEGQTFKREIKLAGDQGMTIDRIHKVMTSICSALHFAHNQNYVHADIKPANIIVDKNDDVYLADFGIARMTDAATATLVGAGTPAYMSPEQVVGDDPSPKSDIYSFAIVLYEMLTGGDRPFIGESVTASGSTGAKVRWEHVHQKPPSVRSYNPDVPEEIDAVILRCLEKKPEDRYATARDLLQAFEYAAGISVPSSLPGDIPDDGPTMMDHTLGLEEDVPASDVPETIVDESDEIKLDPVPAFDQATMVDESDEIEVEPATIVNESDDFLVDPATIVDESDEILVDPATIVMEDIEPEVDVATIVDESDEIEIEPALMAEENIEQDAATIVDESDDPGFDRVFPSKERVVPPPEYPPAEKPVPAPKPSASGKGPNWILIGGIGFVLVAILAIAGVLLLGGRGDDGVDPTEVAEAMIEPEVEEPEGEDPEPEPTKRKITITTMVPTEAPTPIPYEEPEFKVCFVADTAGFEELNYNHYIWWAIEHQIEDRNIIGHVVESHEWEEYEGHLFGMVESDCDLTIANSWTMGESVSIVASENPDHQFVIADVNWIDLPNVHGSDFRVNEASFLAGYLAAGMSESQIVATYMGAYFGGIEAWLDGFVLGVHHYNEVHGASVEVLGWDIEARAGVEAGTFDDWDMGRELGHMFLDEGADVIYPIAGFTGHGTLDAMAERGHGLFIGIDINVDQRYPEFSEFIIASAIKNVELFVSESIEEYLDTGHFQHQTWVGNLEQNGVLLEYSPHWFDNIPQWLKDEIEELRWEIIEGRIQTE